MYDSDKLASANKNRRKFLRAAGAAGITGIFAGCLADDEEDDFDDTDDSSGDDDADDPGQPATLVISNVDYDDNEEYTVGDEISFQVMVDNEGDEAGEGTVILSIGGEELDNATVNIDGGDRAMALLDGDTSSLDPAEHDLEIGVGDDVWTDSIQLSIANIHQISEHDEGRFIDVRRREEEGGGRVAKWVYEFNPADSPDPFDPPASYETYKPFLMLYDPENDNPLTSWPSPEMRDEGYVNNWTHHRGVYIGWGLIDIDVNGDTVSIDNWHNEPTRVEGHDPPVDEFDDTAIVGSNVGWYTGDPDDSDTHHIADEHREFRFRIPPEDDEDVIISFDMVSTVEAHYPMELYGGSNDWDAEHASHQIRTYVDSDVNDDLAYFYSDHYEYGEEQSHENQGEPSLTDRYTDIMWIAGQTELHGEMYHFIWMTHPDNPGQGDPDVATIWSANRDYGRFGHFWEDEWEPGDVTPCVYRILVVKDSFDEGDYDRVEDWYDEFLDDIDEDGDIF